MLPSTWRTWLLTKFDAHQRPGDSEAHEVFRRAPAGCRRLGYDELVKRGAGFHRSVSRAEGVWEVTILCGSNHVPSYIPFSIDLFSVNCYTKNANSTRQTVDSSYYESPVCFCFRRHSRKHKCMMHSADSGRFPGWSVELDRFP